MISRREFIQAGLATSAILGASGLGMMPRMAAAQGLTQDQLLQFDDFGNVTLVHVTDIHAQLKPIWFREPSVNLGVGPAHGLPPHLTGRAFLEAFGIAPGGPEAYALTSDDFVALARAYGRMGGMDRVATVIKAIRAARPEAIILDGGDTWHGSMTALRTRGQDMVEVMNALGVEAMTSHWEWTYGAERVNEIVAGLPFPFLGANIFDAEWDEPAFDPYVIFERGGTSVAVIGQAFPYMPIANPRWMFPDYSFGIRQERMQDMVDEVRAKGAQLVVCLSHNGFDVDRKMAAQVQGIDVILTGHTHDAIPEPVLVGQTILIASGSNGKFVSRVDLDVRDGQMMGFRHKLIPVFADVIAPDPDMAALIDDLRAPFAAELGETIATTESLLYRRGNFNGTWDDVICDAIRAERDAQIALSPGVRWGTTLLPGDPITREDIFNATAMTYGQCYRTQMTGATLRTILEDVADNIFNTDPYYQQGGDMVRLGGLAYTIDVSAPMGKRISDLRLSDDDTAIEPGASYVVAGWASVNEDTEGPQIWDVIESYLRKTGTVTRGPSQTVTIKGA
ncbi:thiosulfohydrolase SoxB [Phaeovulum vinaykumarii]|uniref:Sulfate thiol esterase SoxB n=1 Tax=Phaeovulum vinaykumarii TaxID=407234 RepID=A0A1N7JJ44_9RHOB|nr:thiosulfohydrolase SoxB [Phaeovulum vinaykumarii]SIS49347.1 sulfate thiol esterase SoxB [Phaeovulum vinaykumarii]SOB89640.1 sulfate thiol esterase SoxB [Phaeovulum vinaykumarii]